MSRRWTATCGVALVLVLAVFGANASAKGRGGVDRSFGNGGTVNLDYLAADGSFHSIRSMAVGPERNVFVGDFETTCAGGSCSQTFRLVRLRPDGSLDGSYGAGGSAHLPAPPTYTASAGFAIDDSGRAVVAISQPGSVSVMRLAANGQVDGSFGSLVLPCACEPGAPDVGFDRRGGIAVSTPYAPPWQEGRTRERRLLVARLAASGGLDRGFGAGGLVDLQVPGYEQRSAVRGDGSVVVAATLGVRPGVYLARIDPGGKLDPKFSRRFQRSLRASGPGAVAAAGMASLVPGPRGSIGVLGSLEFLSEGFAMRVGRDGRLDRGFSADGIRRLPLRVGAAVAAGRGRTVVAGQGEEGTEVLVIGAGGRRYRAYGGGRAVVLGSWPEVNGLAMQGPRPLLFTGGWQGCRSYCPPKPKLLRLRALP